MLLLCLMFRKVSFMICIYLRRVSFLNCLELMNINQFDFYSMFPWESWWSCCFTGGSNSWRCYSVHLYCWNFRSKVIFRKSCWKQICKLSITLLWPYKMFHEYVWYFLRTLYSYFLSFMCRRGWGRGGYVLLVVLRMLKSESCLVGFGFPLW